jgi:hypothetical protein
VIEFVKKSEESLNIEKLQDLITQNIASEQNPNRLDRIGNLARHLGRNTVARG